MRRDHAEDAKHFDAIAANRAKAPESCKLAEMLWELAEAHDGDKHYRLGQLAGNVQEHSDRGENVTTTEALMVVEVALRTLGLLK